MKLLLKKVRVAFPALFEAKSYEGSEAKFSAVYLMPPSHPAVKQIEEAAQAVAKEKWGGKADTILKSIKAAGKTCLRDGDTKESTGFEGMMFVSASSKHRPTIVDADGRTALVEADGRPYGGCYVNAYVEIWAMDNQYGKRICASLGGVQFHSHGEPFAGGGGGNESFEAVEDEGSLV